LRSPRVPTVAWSWRGSSSRKGWLASTTGCPGSSESAMGDALYLIGLVALTSALVWVAGRRLLGLQTSALRPALRRLLEWVGLTVLLYALNLFAGFALVLLLRKLTGSFVSMYINTDVTLVLLSAFQALVFQWWRAESE